MEKIIEYLNIRRKKLNLAKEQLRFRDETKEQTKIWLKGKISAKLEEVEGMLERLETIGIDEMIDVAQADYDKKKQRKAEEVRKKAWRREYFLPPFRAQ